MAASPVFQSAAYGRPFVLLPPPPSLLTQLRDTPKLAAIAPASRLEVRRAPEMVASGIPELDALTGGWARGCLSEICGSVSSGRTSVVFAALAQATQRGEACALVDASDALDPASAASAGVEMGQLLWVRCGKPVLSSQFSVPSASKSEREFGLERGLGGKKNSPWRHPSTSFREGSEDLKETEFNRKGRKSFEQRLEQVLKITDLLLQSNGFGMIVLDLADIPALSARRIPLASWFRFRRAIEHTPTVLLVTEQQPIAGSCSSVLLQVSGRGLQAAGGRSQVSGKKPPAFSTQHSAKREAGIAQLSHTELLDAFVITAELSRSRLERKPSQSVVNFRSRAKWAG